LPPLRERREDLLPLAEQFAADAGIQLSPEMRALLAGYRWPGNVRELRNTVQRLAIDPNAASTLGEDLAIRPLTDARARAIEQFEREYLAAVWAAARHNLGRAATLAGTTPQYLGRLLDRNGIRPFRQSEDT